MQPYEMSGRGNSGFAAQTFMGGAFRTVA
jgi:hypothetical protein